MRQTMIQRDLKARDIADKRVLEAMGRVQRQRFVPESQQDSAYADRPLPIGHAQTISQPYIVALMTQVVRPKATDRALDVGDFDGARSGIERAARRIRGGVISSLISAGLHRFNSCSDFASGFI